MRKRIFYFFPFALLTFAFAVLISPTRFWPRSFSLGINRVCSTTYTSSLLGSVVTAGQKYAATEEAEEEFQHRLGRAVRVVELTHPVDEDGTRMDRLLAIFVDERGEYACLVLRDGTHLRSVSSSSLYLVREFEKTHRLD